MKIPFKSIRDLGKDYMTCKPKTILVTYLGFSTIVAFWYPAAISAITATIGVCAVWAGLETWRKEFIEKKNIETAQAVYADFIAARHRFSFIKYREHNKILPMLFPKIELVSELEDFCNELKDDDEYFNKDTNQNRYKIIALKGDHFEEYYTQMQDISLLHISLLHAAKKDNRTDGVDKDITASTEKFDEHLDTILERVSVELSSLL